MTNLLRWQCQQLCQQPSRERVRKGSAELKRIGLASNENTPDFIDDLRPIDGLLIPARKDRTTQAQRPGPRDATMATGGRAQAPRWMGSLQRMVRPLCAHLRVSATERKRKLLRIQRRSNPIERTQLPTTRESHCWLSNAQTHNSTRKRKRTTRRARQRM
jgi:hypothetical protein